MPIDPLGTAIGIAGLLATFKGAVDGYLLLESFFAKDNGLRDLATRFHVERKELEEWRHQFNLQDEDPQACLLHYETDENKHLMFETLDRINKSLIDAQNLLDNHTGNDGLKPKKSSKFWRSRGEKDGPKNRIRWAITNKAKFENCLTAIKAHLENLVRFSKRIQILQLPNWTQVLEWLTQIDENSYHRKARQLRQKGTGRWLLERTEFTQWLAGLAKDLLWVNATPGAGKTILASTVIDELLLVEKLHGANMGIAYFYCDYRDPETQKLSQILGSLTAQLSQQNLAFRAAVWKYYDASRKTYNAARAVEPEILVEILTQSCVEFSQVFLVLDAIDECSNRSSQGNPSLRSSMLDCLYEIQKKANGKIKILITSRPTVDIRKAFLNTPSIPVLSELNSPDIKLYVQEELQKAIEKDPDWLGNEEDPQTVKLLTVSRLVDKANGMFLFAKLQLDILLNSHSDEDVKAALLSLPEDLDETWVRLLQDVDSANSNPRNHEKIRRILRWLVSAVRPLKVDEIKEAIAVEECQMHRNRNAEVKDAQIVDLCGPLVSINEETNELSLAHFSLKEFLLSGKLLDTSEVRARKYNITTSEANAYAAMISLTYLSFRDLFRPCRTLKELEHLRQENRFLDYATLYAGVHLGRVEDANSILISLLNGLFVSEVSRQELLGQQNEANSSLLQMTISAFCPPIENEYAYSRSKLSISMSCLYSKSTVELFAEQTLRRIEDRPNCKPWLQLFRILSDVTRQDHPANITPLYYASLFGWSAGVDKILQLNESRATTSDLNHTLRAAAIGNHCGIIEMLLDAGAQVKAHSDGLGSALQSAAFCGQIEAVGALLALGANAEEQHDYFRPGGTVGSALQGAAVKGDTKIVRILLDNGANVNSNRGWLGTPLQAVMERGMEDMAMVLMESPGFNGGITGGYYGSALRLACQNGGGMMSNTLRAMLTRGAPSTQRVGPYGSLLEVAAHFGFYDKIQLLLDYNATVDKFLGQFGNAIHAASMNGDKRIVKALLDHGADPNCPGHWLGQDYASENLPGQLEYGKTLVLREGEGFLAYGHSGVTRAFFAPLLKAAKRIRIAEHNKVYLILENEPTHRHGHLGHPLQAAAFRGHTQVLRLLIESGSNIDAIGGFFGTALQAAASQGHSEAVMVLLENGAKTEPSPAGHYGSPLSAAIALNFGNIVRALLDKGADPFAKDEHGWDAGVWSTLYRRDVVGMLNDTRTLVKCTPPGAWSVTNKSPKLEIDDSKHTVHFHGRTSLPTWFGIPFALGAAVIADHPVSPYRDYYFEVEILDGGHSQTVCVGLSEKDVPLFKLPGHAASSWGYRGDDGGCFANQNIEGPLNLINKPDEPWPAGASWGYHGDTGRCFAEGEELNHQWPKFTNGDFVGCGIEWGEDRIFFTLNGTRLEPNIPIPRRRLYPALGMMSENASVHTNFGDGPFIYSFSRCSVS